MRQDFCERIAHEMASKFDRHNICNENTDLVIEGYPRSANTFIQDMIAVLFTETTPLRVGHHTHDIRNLQLAECHGVPSCVLIRRPEDAILSYSIFSGMSVAKCVERYRKFYLGVLELKKPFIVAEFDTVTRDFNLVRERINREIEIPIPKSEDYEEDVRRAQAKSRSRAKIRHGDQAFRRGGFPSQERDDIKDKLRGEVTAFLERSPDIKELYRTVTELRG